MAAIPHGASRPAPRRLALVVAIEFAVTVGVLAGLIFNEATGVVAGFAGMAVALVVVRPLLDPGGPAPFLRPRR